MPHYRCYVGGCDSNNKNSGNIVKRGHVAGEPKGHYRSTTWPKTQSSLWSGRPTKRVIWQAKDANISRQLTIKLSLSHPPTQHRMWHSNLKLGKIDLKVFTNYKVLLYTEVNKYEPLQLSLCNHIQMPAYHSANQVEKYKALSFPFAQNQCVSYSVKTRRKKKHCSDDILFTTGKV